MEKVGIIVLQYWALQTIGINNEETVLPIENKKAQQTAGLFRHSETASFGGFSRKNGPGCGT